MYRIKFDLLVLTFLFALITPIIFGQNNLSDYQFVSPVPGSKYNTPETSIIIRKGNKLNAGFLTNSIINVSGSKSGIITGQIKIAEDNKTIIFTPADPFERGEEVTVKFKGGIRTNNNKSLKPIEYKFYITDNPDLHQLSSFELEHGINLEQERFKNYRHETKVDTIPEDFPGLTVLESNNPTDGYIFLAPFQVSGGSSFYLIISDNSGTPIYYKKMSTPCFDFKKQPDGNLTYLDYTTRSYLALDESYNVVDEYKCQNGYSTDNHDLQVFGDNHALLLSYHSQVIDMSEIVEGGSDSALVIGCVIQEIDNNKNVVFQWRSWEHFEITDATDDIDLTADTIDYVHANAVELDNDGNILLSSRHLDEVTKINRQTGDIIWRLGGENNQFTLTNDDRWFSHQHDIRRLSYGNISLFDNSNLNDPQYSRGVEFSIDEDQKELTLIKNYRNNPDIYSRAMGNAQKLESGGYLIGWGTGRPNITEFDLDGGKLFEMDFEQQFLNYRAYRFNWRTNLFATSSEYIGFGDVPVDVTASLAFRLTNNSIDTITISEFYHKNSSFNITQGTPFNLMPGANVYVNVEFTPEELGIYIDTLHIRTYRENEMIAQTVILNGSCVVSVNDDKNSFDYNLAQNYPNPFNPVTIIRYSIPKSGSVKLKIFDVLGNEIKTLIDEKKEKGSYQVEFKATNLPSGIYFYQLKINEFIDTKKMLLIK